MRLEDCKPGMRVVCYSYTRVIGTIIEIRGDVIKLDLGPSEFHPKQIYVHPKQLRRLKKKPRERAWTMQEIGQAWDKTVKGSYCNSWSDSSVAAAFIETILSLPEGRKKE